MPTMIPLLSRTQPHPASQRRQKQKRRGKGLRETSSNFWGREKPHSGRKNSVERSLSNPQQCGSAQPRSAGQGEPAGPGDRAHQPPRGAETPRAPGSRRVSSVGSGGCPVSIRLPLHRKGLCSSGLLQSPWFPMDLGFTRGYINHSQQKHSAFQITPCSHGHLQGLYGQSSQTQATPSPR